MIKSASVDVSIVIPAYNEQNYIAKCLEAISNLKTDFKFEVIIVDNNSTDKTYEIVKGFQNKLNIKIFKENKQGRGAARARGFKESKAEIILSTDADTIVYDSWMDTLVLALGDQVVATTTSCKITDGSILTNLLFNLAHPATAYFYGFIFGNSWLFGFSFAILKSSYLKSGGFNPDFQAQEDFDLGYRVSKIGRIKFINKPVIFSGRRFKDGLLVGIYAYVHTFIQAFILKKENIYLGNPR